VRKQNDRFRVGSGSVTGLREINLVAVDLSVKLTRRTADDHVRQGRQIAGTHQWLVQSRTRSAIDALGSTEQRSSTMARFAIVAAFDIAEGRMDEFLPPLLAHRDRCLKEEPGKLRFDVLRPKELANQVMF
jgi:hypothetical protein